MIVVAQSRECCFTDIAFTQEYITEFQIDHFQWFPDTLPAVKTITDPMMRTAVSAALLALKMFKVDAMAVVRAGVEADIEASLALVDPPTMSDCSKRRRLLTKWERNPKPFAAEQDPFYALLRCVVTDPILVALGLPGATRNKMSVDSFCSSVYDMARDGGIKAGIMVVPKGSFLPVCRVALRAIAALYGKHAPATQKNFFMKAVAKALALADIHHFPYQSTRTTVGRPSTAPTWDSWCTFGGAAVTAERTIRTSTLLPAEAAGLALRTALNGATANNILGDWRCAHIALGDILDVLKHEKLPQDFVRLGNTDYVTSNMDWVIDNFDFGNKLHTLALMYGFIVKYMNPAVYTPKDYPARLKQMNTSTDKHSTLAALRALPWQMKGNKLNAKGNTQTDVFVVMFTAFVIGLYEDGSPIAEHMNDNKDTLGTALTSKYGKLIHFLRHQQTVR